MIQTNELKRLLTEQGIQITEKQLLQFDRYAELLVEWNERMNLTAITEPDEMIRKHFLDSAMLLSYVSLPKNAAVIDVGTGAGFPSVPCAILRPDLKLTLLDSLNKRITFLSALCCALGISAECVHARAEEGGRMPLLREQFDLATARAVAHLRELSEYCLPFVKVGGLFAALKGPDLEKELSEAKSAICLLGGKIEQVEEYNLDEVGKRTLVLIRKISQTSSKYPRMTAKIKKQKL